MPHDDRVTLPSFPSLTSLPATEHPDLVAAPVAAALAAWPGAAEVAVVGIDPDLADTAAMSEAYDIPMTASGNCVVVAGARAGDERIAACVVRADTRADVNTLVRKTARRAQGVLPPDGARGRRDRHGVRRHHPARAAGRVARAGPRRACSTSPSSCSAAAYDAPSCSCPDGVLADLPGAEVVPDLGR